MKAAFWPSHRETRSLGQGERGEIQFPVSLPSQCGSLNNHHQLLPTCWMLAKQGRTATHILSFPSCSPVFHMSKQAGNSETHKNEITTLRSKMWDYHTESKTLLTHCSVTPFTTCTGKSHTKQLPGGEFFSGAKQGWAWGETSNGLCHQGERTELELLPKVVLLNITYPLGSVWSSGRS